MEIAASAWRTRAIAAIAMSGCVAVAQRDGDSAAKPEVRWDVRCCAVEWPPIDPLSSLGVQMRSSSVSYMVDGARLMIRHGASIFTAAPDAKELVRHDWPEPARIAPAGGAEAMFVYADRVELRDIVKNELRLQIHGAFRWDWEPILCRDELWLATTSSRDPAALRLSGGKLHPYRSEDAMAGWVYSGRALLGVAVEGARSRHVLRPVDDPSALEGAVITDFRSAVGPQRVGGEEAIACISGSELRVVREHHADGDASRPYRVEIVDRAVGGSPVVGLVDARHVFACGRKGIELWWLEELRWRKARKLQLQGDVVAIAIHPIRPETAALVKLGDSIVLRIVDWGRGALRIDPVGERR